MGFLDWIGRNRGPVAGAGPRVTWISDVYGYRSPDAQGGALKESWVWAWVHETSSGEFDAGMTVRDQAFNFTKWRTGEGFDREAKAIHFAQTFFKAWREGTRPERGWQARTFKAT